MSKTGGITVLEKLRVMEKVIGVKQSRRAVRDNLVQMVFLACDADPAVTEPVAQQCAEKQIPVMDQFTMREMGQAAGIQVGAAVVALLKKD
jgi:large subunit ribosomal protein L7A